MMSRTRTAHASPPPPRIAARTAPTTALRRKLGNRELVRLLRAGTGIAYRKGDAGTPAVDAGTPAVKFQSLETPEAEKDFQRRVADYIKKGKSPFEASFLATDDMFAERLKGTGGKRAGERAAFPELGETTFMAFKSAQPREHSPTIEAEAVTEVVIDDANYNCHSFTFQEAKVSKLALLKTLARDATKTFKGAPKGTMFYDRDEVTAKGIHIEFNIGPQPLILPRWVIASGEIVDLLAAYRPATAGEALKAGGTNIVMYSSDGNFSSSGEFLHSGKVTQVDAKGNPTKVKSKWGQHSLFEHDPEAVPAHYGKPYFFRKK